MTNLIFVPGMFSSDHAWDKYVSFFSKKGYHCIVINLKENIDLKKATLVDYIEKTKKDVTKDDIVIGHSMGGLIVQKIAEEIPIKAAVAIAPSPPKGFKAQQLSIQYLQLILRSIRYLPKIMFSTPFIPSFSFLRLILLNNMDKQTARNYYKELEKQSAKIVVELITSKYEVNENKIHSPLLYIGKKKDRLVPSNVVEKVAHKHNATFILVDGSHYITNNWQETAEAINEFIGKYRKEK